MKLPRVRFTIRRMMIAIAVGTTIIRGVTLWQKAVVYRWKIGWHAYREEHSFVAAVIEGTHSAGPDELARLNRAWTAYHAALKLWLPHTDYAIRVWSLDGPLSVSANIKSTLVRIEIIH